MRGFGPNQPTPNDEKEPIHGEPDRGDPQGRRLRSPRRIAVPQPWHQHRDLLQLEEPLRRPRGFRAEAHQGTRGRAIEAQADVCRLGHGERGPQRADLKKALTPGDRREAVAWLVDERELPLVRACDAVGMSTSTWYRPPRSRGLKDQPVIDALNALVARHPRWGFSKCYH